MSSLHTRLFGLLACSWGAVLLYFYHSMRVRKYLAPDFHHYILIGGIGILILGIYSVINPKEKSSACGHDHDHDHDDHHDHDHDEPCDHEHEEGHGPFATILLTMIPLMLALANTKDAYSNTALAKKAINPRALVANSDRPAFTREDLEKRVPRNEYGEFEIRILTAFYAAGDPELQGIFEGLPVELEGRIAPEKLNNEQGDRLRLFRTIITCCAADLQVVGVTLKFPENATRPAPDDWVKAGGILTFETLGEDVNPVLEIREVVQAEEPYSEFQQRQ